MGVKKIIENESVYYVVEDRNENKVEIGSDVARDIFFTLDKEYHVEDIENELENREIEFDDKDIKKEAIDEILNKYEDYLSENDSWSYCLDNAINDCKYLWEDGEDEENEE